MNRRPLLEICVDSMSGLAAAIDGGADRIELCQALSVGGLTPSPGLLRAAVEAPVPVYCMIRPRPGDFLFSENDLRQMEFEITAVRQAGLAGVVIGATGPDQALEPRHLRRLRDAAGPLGVTLHRAFDLVPDPEAALEQAVDLGFERILTSGQAPRAVDGAALIRDLVRRADGRISVMAGSGITPANAKQIVETTGSHEIHASAAATGRPLPERCQSLGFAQTSSLSETDIRKVRALKQALTEDRGTSS